MASVLSSSRSASSNEDRRKSKDLVHSSLSSERPYSTSAFPSPASSFIPPQMPSSHDYSNTSHRHSLASQSQSTNGRNSYTSLTSSNKKQSTEETQNNSFTTGANGYGAVNGYTVSPTSSGTQLPQAQAPMSANANRHSAPLTHSSLLLSSTTKSSDPPSTVANPHIASSTNSLAFTPPQSPSTISHVLPVTPPSQSASFSSSTLSSKRISQNMSSSTPSSSSTSPSDSSQNAITDESPSSTSIGSKHTSLTPSRPAPVSPTISRRASRQSGSQSTAPSRRSSQRYVQSSSQAQAQQTTPTQPKAHLVLVRDFAYSPDDLRHVGKGPDAPRLSRTSSVSDPFEYNGNSGNSKRRSSGWGPFKWGGSVFGGLGTGSSGGSGSGSKFWSFGSGRKDRDQNQSGMPSKTDFTRNFDMSNVVDDSTAQEDDSGDEDYVNEDDDEEDEDSNSEPYPDPSIPLLPGLYRAMYAFEPEGGAEMRLSEGQIVRVIGRGGGIGWAVVVKDEDDKESHDDEEGEEERRRRLSGHALVPESYLELVKADSRED